MEGELIPPELPPAEPELPPLCPPDGIDGELAPPPEEPPPDGMLDPPDEPLEPELPPLGMLAPPPELPDEPDEPDEPDDPEEPPGDGLGMVGDGMLDEEDWAQPPIRNAEMVPISVVFAAMTRSRLSLGRWVIAKVSGPRPMPGRSQLNCSYSVARFAASQERMKKSATAKLNTR